jgi:hypothetical protein
MRVPALVLVGLFGCSKAPPTPVDRPVPVAQPETPPPAVKPPPATPATIAIQMTAATLADDCGSAPATPPSPPVKAAKSKSDDAGPKAKRKCEQTSIQLSITAPAGAKPAELTVKKVELFDEAGTSLGVLEVRAPSLWSDANGYMPWDQKITPPAELSVSYALGRPDWSKVKDRWNKTYVVKAVLAFGGADQTVQQNVEVGAPTTLPPNVKT